MNRHLLIFDHVYEYIFGTLNVRGVHYVSYLLKNSNNCEDSNCRVPVQRAFCDKDFGSDSLRFTKQEANIAG
jgi:hypothetical protein